MLRTFPSSSCLKCCSSVAATGRLPFDEEAVQCSPERDAPGSRRFAQALNFLLIRAQHQPEHVGNHFFAELLPFELAHQPDEHFVGDVRKRGTHAIGGRELRDQDHRLANDGID